MSEIKLLAQSRVISQLKGGFINCWEFVSASVPIENVLVDPDMGCFPEPPSEPGRIFVNSLNLLRGDVLSSVHMFCDKEVISAMFRYASSYSDLFVPPQM